MGSEPVNAPGTAQGRWGFLGDKGVGLGLGGMWQKPGSCLRARCVLQAACDVFCVGDDVNIEKANNSLISNDRSWKRSKFRLTYVAEAPELTQGAETEPPQRAQGQVEERRRSGGKGARPPCLFPILLY